MPVMLTVRDLLWAARRSGLYLRFPLPLDEPPILQLIEHLGLLPEYIAGPLCLRCGADGDASVMRWETVGVLCTSCLAEEVQVQRRSLLDPETGEYWVKTYIKRLQWLQSREGRAVIEADLAAKREVLLPHHRGRYRLEEQGADAGWRVVADRVIDYRKKHPAITWDQLSGREGGIPGRTLQTWVARRERELVKQNQQ